MVDGQPEGDDDPRQARRALHAARSRRRAEEARTLAGRRRNGDAAEIRRRPAREQCLIRLKLRCNPTRTIFRCDGGHAARSRRIRACCRTPMITSRLGPWIRHDARAPLHPRRPARRRRRPCDRRHRREYLRPARCARPDFAEQARRAGRRPRLLRQSRRSREAGRRRRESDDDRRCRQRATTARSSSRCRSSRPAIRWSASSSNSAAATSSSATSAQKTAALGSGFIISADGYVVTNNHVDRQSERRAGHARRWPHARRDGRRHRQEDRPRAAQDQGQGCLSVRRVRLRRRRASAIGSSRSAIRSASAAR